jgi:endonuclease YncB( thermonuclease family)
MNRIRTFGVSLWMMLAMLVCHSPPTEAAPPIPNYDVTDGPLYKVHRIVDGDTVALLVKGKEVKVRLIGVDTPETVHPQEPVEYY